MYQTCFGRSGGFAPVSLPLFQGRRPLPDYVTEFLSTSDGVALAKAFTRMRNIKLRRRIVRLAVEIMRRM
jgi:hypothetical protein